MKTSESSEGSIFSIVIVFPLTLLQLAITISIFPWVVSVSMYTLPCDGRAEDECFR